MYTTTLDQKVESQQFRNITLTTERRTQSLKRATEGGHSRQRLSNLSVARYKRYFA
jgi:hypothetical protein